MIFTNTSNKTLCTILIGAASMWHSPIVLAHTGHSHGHHDTLSGSLHTLTTHPLLFGIVGLLLLSALIIKR